jgi:hypothetical protein
MKFYQTSEKFLSFETVEAALKKNLPKDFQITSLHPDDSTSTFTHEKIIGEIKIRQNSYNGVVIALSSVENKFYLSLHNYIPGKIVNFINEQASCSLTKWILASFYGTGASLYEAVNNIIQKNFMETKKA